MKMNQLKTATALTELARANRAGEQVGIYSVCSAHPLVLEAAIEQARDDQTTLLIEATCNQVNQFGGYTDLRPADFSNWVEKLCREYGIAPDDLVLGGDHLGPNPWKSETADEAMRKAETLVEEYVKAGFVKIHLDASMACADDESPVDPATIAQRSAQLCAVAERAAEAAGTSPVYVIGTEVPVPGGELRGHDIQELDVTSPARAEQTITLHQQAFEQAGLQQAFDRVVALVVQPGVEFSHHEITHYNAEAAQALRGALPSQPTLIYEAHSTDYQTETALSELVRDHFAILKVGPELTFALREALFALEHMEQELVAGAQQSGLRTAVEQAMQAAPEHWQPYYSDDPEQARFDRIFSFSDRIRYYWQQPAVLQALETLYQNLRTAAPSPTVVHAYLTAGVRNDFQLVSKAPQDWVKSHIRRSLQRYSRACSQTRDTDE